MINSFRGENYFLSNFYNAQVLFEGAFYNNNEAAFQAAKMKNPADRKNVMFDCDGMRLAFTQMPAKYAKRHGRRVTLRDDWENIKYDVMLAIVRDKFTRHTELKAKLLATGNEPLEEGNTWGDRTWGTVNGVGQNLLGKILMQVRDELRS